MSYLLFSSFDDDFGLSILIAFLPFILLFIAIFILGLLVFIKIIKNPKHFYKNNPASLISFGVGLLFLSFLYLDRSTNEAPVGFLGDEWFLLRAGLGLVVFSWILLRKKHEPIDNYARKTLKVLPRIVLIGFISIVFLLAILLVVYFVQDNLASRQKSEDKQNALSFAETIEQSSLAFSNSAVIEVDFNCTYELSEYCVITLGYETAYSIDESKIELLNKNDVTCKEREIKDEPVNNLTRLDCVLKTNVSRVYLDALYETHYGRNVIKHENDSFYSQ